MTPSRLRALGLAIGLFVAVYAPVFAVTAFLRPRIELAIPLVIAISFAIALILILLLARRKNGLAEFGFKISNTRWTFRAIAFGRCVGLAATFLSHLFPSKPPLDVSRLSLWMIALYFIIGSSIQEEVIFSRANPNGSGVIDQVAVMLAQVMKKQLSGDITGAKAELNAHCHQTLGLDISQVQRMSPEAVTQLLDTAGGLRQARAIMLAELLLKDAELEEHDHSRVAIDQIHAFCLLARAIAALDIEDQQAYRPKLQALADRLRRLQSNPYIAAKWQSMHTVLRPIQAMQPIADRRGAQTLLFMNVICNSHGG